MNKKITTLEPKKKIGGIEDLWREDIVEFDSEELDKILEESERQYREGRVRDAKEVFKRLHEKFRNK